MVLQISETQSVYDLLSAYIPSYKMVEQQAKADLFKALSVYVGINMAEATPEEIAAVQVETIPFELLVFFYKTEDIFEEVYKRTSYIARSRRDKETKEHLLDVISMTMDDESVFNPFLIDASVKVFERLAPFTREVSGAYMYKLVSGIAAPVSGTTYDKGDKVLYLTKVYELTGATTQTVGTPFDPALWTAKSDAYYTEDKLEYVTLRPDWFNMNALQGVDTAIFEALVSFIMGQWFMMVYPDEAATYLERFSTYLQSITSSINSQNRPINRTYRPF